MLTYNNGTFVKTKRLYIITRVLIELQTFSMFHKTFTGILFLFKDPNQDITLHLKTLNIIVLEEK